MTDAGSIRVKRELCASKLVGAHCTKSLKIKIFFSYYFKHFVFISRQLKIRIIEYDGSGFVDSERNPHEDFVVSRFIVHPNFNKKRLSDDIAVIILEQPIDLVSKQGKLLCNKLL